MRFAAIKTIYENALKNKNVYFLTGDLGHFGEKEFAEKIPHQYHNVGIAEQNMVGIAAGLALTGKKIFAYSIVPFVTLRCLEQIKNDVCYQNLDVTLIGVGGGLIYGPYGNTHCSIEDVAVMRALPNMKVVCPANAPETEQIIKQLMKIKGPTYVRIGRGKEPMPATSYTVSFGKGKIINKGTDIVIFSTGTILEEAQKLVQMLTDAGISTELINLHTVKPIDKNLILKKIRTRRAIFTIEEASLIGGLGSAVAEIVSESSKRNLVFKRFGVNDLYLKEIGDQNYLRKKHHLSAETIYPVIIDKIT
ncbi:1-deoxy-D-xylulose-5-phosphate synthase [Patescibacteria group bacterium]|nr:1-deoxy-D-xylulose-5-phosphate synthase [Patescibacteria group bacterium]